MEYFPGLEMGSYLVSVGHSLGNGFCRGYYGKEAGKFVPCLQVFEGVVTAWIPGVMLLLNWW